MLLTKREREREGLKEEDSLNKNSKSSLNAAVLLVRNASVSSLTVYKCNRLAKTSP